MRAPPATRPLTKRALIGSFWMGLGAALARPCPGTTARTGEAGARRRPESGLTLPKTHEGLAAYGEGLVGNTYQTLPRLMWRVMRYGQPRLAAVITQDRAPGCRTDEVEVEPPSIDRSTAAMLLAMLYLRHQHVNHCPWANGAARVVPTRSLDGLFLGEQALERGALLDEGRLGTSPYGPCLRGRRAATRPCGLARRLRSPPRHRPPRGGSCPRSSRYGGCRPCRDRPHASGRRWSEPAEAVGDVGPERCNVTRPSRYPLVRASPSRRGGRPARDAEGASLLRVLQGRLIARREGHARRVGGDTLAISAASSSGD